MTNILLRTILIVGLIGTFNTARGKAPSEAAPTPRELVNAPRWLSSDDPVYSAVIGPNQHRKWVMMDPTANMHLEKDGVPLNGFEIRQEWFYRQGTNLVFVVGKERKHYRKADLPIFLGRFAGFGDLTVPTDELCKYGFMGYLPNTDLMDSGPDYGRMFIVKDKLCEGTHWHTRRNPANPEADPYFPINQAALSLNPERDKLRVTLQTMTPNFQRYEARMDGGARPTPGPPTPG